MAARELWGLVCLIDAQELGIDLTNYGEVSAKELLRVARSIVKGQESWEPTNDPAAFDVVVMRLYDRAWVGHVGVMVDARTMIHTEARISVSVVPVDHFTVRDRIASYRRHV